MLEPLVYYAKRKGLGSNPAFQKKDVKWAVVLDERGHFRRIIPLGNPEDKGWQGKPFTNAPYTPTNILNAGGKSNFLVESAQVVLNIPPDKPKRNKTLEETGQANKEKHDYFKTLIVEASTSGASSLSPVVTFLQDDQALETARKQFAGQKKAKPTDSLTFIVGNDYLLEKTDWHAYWEKKLSAISQSRGSSTLRMPCLATGIFSEPIKNHGKIKGVKGANLGNSASLVANDKEAFQSYGLDAAYNAPVSYEAESRYRAALQERLEHSLDIGSKSSDGKWYGFQFVYWTRDATSVDPVAPIRDGEESKTDFFSNDPALAEGSLLSGLRAVLDGRYIPRGTDGNIFYGCSLSANGGRIVIRDWWEQSLTEILKNLYHWADDLSIVRLDGGLLELPKLHALLFSLVPEQKGLDDLPPHLAVRIIRSALWNLPLPRLVLQLALRRHSIEFIRGTPHSESSESKRKEKERRISLRSALIKAYLNRSKKEEDPVMSPELNPDEKNPAYRCGRLLAVLEQIQRKAMPEIESGIVERYYGAASSAPALVFPRLIKLSKHHLVNLSPKLAYHFQKLIEEITERQAFGYFFPRVLTLEEQGRFALGYYHQRAYRAPQMEEPDENEKGGETDE